MKPMLRATLTCMLSVTVAGLPLVTQAADPYEPDDSAVPQYALLIHGTKQARDLDGVGDVDYIQIDAVPGRSYEIRLFTSGNFPANMSRRNDVDAVVQAADPYVMNTSRQADGRLTSYNPHSSSVLVWIEDVAVVNRSRYIRVDSNGTVRTAADSQYTIQMRETTLYCPRYNNSGSQTTVLIVQDTSPQESFANANGCTWTANFYDQGYNVFGHALNGSHTGSNSFGDAIAPNGMIVLPTASVFGVAGTRGSIQVAHTCGYGNAMAKAVALEPATGFSFDTICQPRPE